MNSTAYIVINLLALVSGQWLVTRGHWSGFLVWCAANGYSIVTCLLTGMAGTSCLFAAYFVVNFASLWSWLGRSRTGRHPPAPAPVAPPNPDTLRKMFAKAHAVHGGAGVTGALLEKLRPATVPTPRS